MLHKNSHLELVLTCQFAFMEGYTSEECFGAFLCSQLMSRILRSIDVSFVSIDLYWSAEQRQRLNASETWRWPAEWPLAILALAALLSAALLTLLLVIFCLTSSRSLATKPALLLRAFIYLSLGVGLVTGSIFQALSRTHLLGLLDYTSHVLLAAFSVFPLLFFELIIFAYQQEVVFADNPDIRDASVLYSKLLLET